MDTPPTAAAASAAVPPAASTEDKTIAIICYFTLIGFIIALVMHSSKKTKLGAFHLRQMLGLIVTSVCLWIIAIIPIIGWILMPIIFIALLVFWLLGLISAVNGQMKPLPLVGEYYQKWFGTAFD